jgi:peptidyl-prolyl cis-trans isomerase C
MATVYQNRENQNSGTADSGYATYQELDTTVPPKARPVLNAVSVNGVEIPEADILAEAQNHPADTPGAALAAAARALAIRQILLQEAKRIGIESRPENGPDGRSETPEDAAIRALMEQEVVVPSASEEECRRYYLSNLEKFRSETIFEARHILLAAAPGDVPAREKARSVAESLLEMITESPSSFAALASEFSDCPSASQGGNLGQFSRGSTVAEFERALAGMEEGVVCNQPVESRFGFHIIRLDRKIEGRLLPFEMIELRIAAWLEAAAWSKAVSQYIAILAGSADIRGVDLIAAEGPLLQ